MKVFITGAAGFIGSHLCEQFLNSGHEVVGIDNFSTGRVENITHLFKNSSFEFFEHDICTKFHYPDKLDAVLHFASPASPPEYLNLPLETLDVGSIGTKNALKLAQQRGAKFLLASTSEVYGDPLVNPQPESYRGNTSTTGTRAVYDEAKRFAESITMAFYRVHKVDTRIVRLFNTFGPRMKAGDGRIIPNFIMQAMSGNPLTVYGTGMQTRSLCYIDDSVRGIMALLAAPENHDVHFPVNIGNPHEMTVLDVALLIIEMTASRSVIKYCDLPEDDPRVRCPDIQRARQLLSWEPSVLLKYGLTRAIAYFQESGGIIK